MNAGHLFIVCFAACTFSFVGVVVATWQIARAMIKRWIKSALPELIKAGMGAPDVGAAFTAGFNVTAPPLATMIMCRQCYRKQLSSVSDAAPHGWVIDRVLGGWACWKCNGMSVSINDGRAVRCTKHDEEFSPAVHEYCRGCRKELVAEPGFTP